jgi:hypothetical protein
MIVGRIFNKLKSLLRKLGNFCNEPYWAHEWDYGSIVQCDNVNAIEKYTCKRCDVHRYVILGSRM